MDRYTISRAILSFLSGESAEELVEHIFGETEFNEERIRNWAGSRSALMLHEKDFKKFVDISIENYIENTS